MLARFLILLTLLLLAALPLGGAPAPAGLRKKVTNSIGMKLVLIPRGTFAMGSPSGEAGRLSHEGPQHEVEISRPFYLGAHEVTQKQYKAVMGRNPSWFSPTGAGRGRLGGRTTDDFPVDSVTWQDAVDFCKKLSGLPKEKSARRFYRLPSEAEWEYACRAGTRTAFAFGNTLSLDRGNFAARLRRPRQVGSYKPNAWGLYDMHGNMYEWCADWYQASYYHHSPKKDPPGPATGSMRVMRNGCFDDAASNCRSAHRFGNTPTNRGRGVGFRVVCTVGGRR